MNQSKKGVQAIETRKGGKATVLPVCSFCNQVPEQGIKGVMRVGKAWLCQACETKIMLLEVGSADYEIMIDKMRNVWKHPTGITHVF